MTLKIYHNPRCSKSRQTLALIEEAGIAPEVVLYLETPPTKPALKKLLKQLGLSPRELLRKGEPAFKELGLKDSAHTDDEIIDLMIENPKLIERPIVSDGTKSVLGRPPENVLELLK